MTNHSRRRLLKSLGALTALAFTGQKAFSSAVPVQFPDVAEQFEFLVLGDSLVWGQGLKEQDKFYSLTKEWLETEVFSGERRINLKVAAHSGAKLVLTESESASLRRAEQENNLFHPEVNVVFPSIRSQIDFAREAYQNENIATSKVKLILLTGGITDIKVSEVLNPYASDDKLRKDIERYCQRAMLEILRHCALVFPRALVAVVGYYPIVSAETPTKNLFEAVLELYETPRLLKPVINNAAQRNLYLGRLHKKLTRRSQIWFEDSNRAFQRAVSKINAELEATRAVFIKSPLTAANSYAAEQTLLWEIDGKTIKDDQYEQRKSACRAALPALRASTRQTYRTRLCELASVGHPNPAGAAKIAEAIKNELRPFFSVRQGLAPISGI